ncbi:DUF3017 domain-containing protein [Corynebacterium flavescens]|uniref:DUF3017 domain-containing protein n=1 Tax=Corynebacterium flavescens TaxID=28028 RepID=UPI003FD4A666
MSQALSLDNPHDRGLAPSRLPGAVQWAMIGLFIAGVAVSGVFAFSEHWRRATVVLGASLLWLSLVRSSCDSQRVGVLAVRSRRFDAFFTAVLGAAMTFLAASVDALGS